MLKNDVDNKPFVYRKRGWAQKKVDSFNKHFSDERYIVDPHTPDLLINPVGTFDTVIFFRANTKYFKDWLEENVHIEDWQYASGSGVFGIDHRPARAFVEFVKDEGFVVQPYPIINAH